MVKALGLHVLEILGGDMNSPALTRRNFQVIAYIRSTHEMGSGLVSRGAFVRDRFHLQRIRGNERHIL